LCERAQEQAAPEASGGLIERETEQPVTISANNIHYAAPTVPQGAKEAFSEVCAQALNDYVASARTGGQEHKEAQDNLLLLATRLLDCTNGSHRRKSKVNANIKRYEAGVIGPVKQLSAGRRGAAEQTLPTEFTNNSRKVMSQEQRELRKRERWQSLLWRLSRSSQTFTLLPMHLVWMCPTQCLHRSHARS
jgi:hypothetical protein